MNLEKEMWKPIQGYEGLYEISNLGRIKSLERCVENNGGKQIIKEKILKTHPNQYRNNYCQVSLCKDGIVKKHQVHRLVAQAFIKNPNNLPQINHKDENPTNNEVSNLEWCTAKYNSNYGNHNINVSKSRSKKVSQYDMEGNFIKSFKNTVEAGRYLNKSSGSIRACRCGKLKTAYGYIWK